MERIKGPLTGITVIDFTRVLAGPYCTMMLADMGARVIKIERPETGDDSRQIGPFIKGTSAYFSSINREKESIALDLRDDDDRRILDGLLAQADVLTESFRPGTMTKLGLGYDDLKEKHPKLIYASTSGFGHTGPYSARPAYDMVVQGMGGIMSVTGHPDSPPTRVGSSIGDIVAGLFTAVGINAALFRRTITGEGERIDIAMLDCQLAILENAVARYVATGDIPGPIGARHPSIAPFEAYEVSDGHIIVAAGNDTLFGQLADVIGNSALKEDERFLTNPLRVENVDALKTEIERQLMADTMADWLALFETEGIPSGPINNVQQVMSDPQIAARNMVVTAVDPVAGEMKMAGNPIKLSHQDDPSVRRRAPHLDEHRQALLQEFDLA